VAGIEDAIRDSTPLLSGRVGSDGGSGPHDLERTGWRHRWGQTVELPLTDVASDVHINVYERRSMHNDRCLGRIIVPLHWLQRWRWPGPVAVLRAATGCDDGAGAAPRSPGNSVLHNGSPELDFTRRSGAEAPDGLEIVAPDGRAGGAAREFGNVRPPAGDEPRRGGRMRSASVDAAAAAAKGGRDAPDALDEEGAFRPEAAPTAAEGRLSPSLEAALLARAAALSATGAGAGRQPRGWLEVRAGLEREFGRGAVDACRPKLRRLLAQAARKARVDRRAAGDFLWRWYCVFPHPVESHRDRDAPIDEDGDGELDDGDLRSNHSAFLSKHHPPVPRQKGVGRGLERPDKPLGCMRVGIHMTLHPPHDVATAYLIPKASNRGPHELIPPDRAAGSSGIRVASGAASSDASPFSGVSSARFVGAGAGPPPAAGALGGEAGASALEGPRGPAASRGDGTAGSKADAGRRGRGRRGARAKAARKRKARLDMTQLKLNYSRIRAFKIPPVWIVEAAALMSWESGVSSACALIGVALLCFWAEPWHLPLLAATSVAACSAATRRSARPTVFAVPYARGRLWALRRRLKRQTTVAASVAAYHLSMGDGSAAERIAALVRDGIDGFSLDGPARSEGGGGRGGTSARAEASSGVGANPRGPAAAGREPSPRAPSGTSGLFQDCAGPQRVGGSSPAPAGSERPVPSDAVTYDTFSDVRREVSGRGAGRGAKFEIRGASSGVDAAVPERVYAVNMWKDEVEPPNKNYIEKFKRYKGILIKLTRYSGRLASVMERASNLFSWTDPQVTAIALTLLGVAACAASAVLWLIPVRVLVFALYAGANVALVRRRRRRAKARALKRKRTARALAKTSARAADGRDVAAVAHAQHGARGARAGELQRSRSGDGARRRRLSKKVMPASPAVGEAAAAAAGARVSGISPRRPSARSARGVSNPAAPPGRTSVSGVRSERSTRFFFSFGCCRQKRGCCRRGRRCRRCCGRISGHKIDRRTRSRAAKFTAASRLRMQSRVATVTAQAKGGLRHLAASLSAFWARVPDGIEEAHRGICARAVIGAQMLPPRGRGAEWATSDASRWEPPGGA
jgi:hypothetical protein